MMIVYVEARVSPNDPTLLQEYVEMAEEEYEGYRERLAGKEGIERHNILCEVQAKYPRCHHKLRRYCRGSL